MDDESRAGVGRLRYTLAEDDIGHVVEDEKVPVCSLRIQTQWHCQRMENSVDNEKREIDSIIALRLWNLTN